MPVIRINDSTFMNLKSISDWLGTKTPSEAISRLIEEKMTMLDLEPDTHPDHEFTPNNAIVFTKTPGITHTKILYACVNDRELQHTNWGEIMLTVIKLILNKGITQDKMVTELQINAVTHQKEDRGYRFYPELGLSLQGQSATDAWKETVRLAKKHNIPIKVKFQWRDKPGAQYPNQIGIMNIAC